MAQLESFELEEIVKNNNLNFSKENWNTQTVNTMITVIKRYFKIKNKTINTKHSSTELKRLIVKAGFGYCTIEDFIIAMLAQGFTCKIINCIFYFNVAEKEYKTLYNTVNQY